jgi:ankyrin repeat protein
VCISRHRRCRCAAAVQPLASGARRCFRSYARVRVSDAHTLCQHGDSLCFLVLYQYANLLDCDVFRSFPAAQFPPRPPAPLTHTHTHTHTPHTQVRSLLGAGADPEHTDADGHFPLLLAVQYARSLPLVRLLVERGGADPTRCASLDLAAPAFAVSAASVASSSSAAFPASSASASSSWSAAAAVSSLFSSSSSSSSSSSTAAQVAPSLLDIAQRLGQADVCRYLLTRGALPQFYDADDDATAAAAAAAASGTRGQITCL